MTADSTATTAAGPASALRASLPGILAAAALWVVVFAVRPLAEPLLWFAGLGVAVAAASAVLAALVHVRMLARPETGPMALAVQASVTQSLAWGFLAKVLGLGLGLAVLLLLEVKFDRVAAFALAFAAASIVIQLSTAARLNRAQVRKALAAKDLTAKDASAPLPRS